MLGARFYEATAELCVPGMGTENVAPFLYSLIRMLRPRTVLEVGLGYTTPFIVQALEDNVKEFQADREIVRGAVEAPGRNSILLRQYFDDDYQPRLHAIDDYSTEGTSAPKVLAVINSLGLSHLIDMHEGDFRAYSKRMAGEAFPIDLAWFDCGGVNEYADFIEEYWPLINEDHGNLILHYTYWPFPDEKGDWSSKRMLIGPLVNEIRKQQLESGTAGKYEVVSLLEPHKYQQGSLTMIRKLAPASMCRDSGFQDELEFLYGSRPKPLIRL